MIDTMEIQTFSHSDLVTITLHVAMVTLAEQRAVISFILEEGQYRFRL